MSKVIVGIHGLANKPKKDILADWWKKSIKEGLNKNCQIAEAEFRFEMVYWADLLYKNPQHGDKLFDFDSLYNGQPYVEAEPASLKEYEDGFLDDIRAKALGLVGSTADMLKERFEMNKLADWVLGKVLKDLAIYYDPERKIGDRSEPKQPVEARKVLQDELKNALIPLKGEEIMLIAHSMGTIISYDVLRDIGPKGSDKDPDFEIAHFVTIGSPLGLPHVKGKIIEERDYDGQGRERVRTPSVVSERWVNYADRKDPVALDVHLRDDYRQNKKGIRVEDDLVINGYLSPSDEPNHHKSYGYLRTPELSEHIRDFLT